MRWQKMSVNLIKFLPADAWVNRTAKPLAGWLPAKRRGARHGEPWPFSYLELPADIVSKSHMAAYVRAKELLLRRSGRKRDIYWKRRCHAPTISTPPLLYSRPTRKSWLEYTCNEN